MGSDPVCFADEEMGSDPIHFPYNSVILLDFRTLTPPRLFALLLALVLAAALPAQAQKKVLRFAFRTAESGFDPQRADDRYSVGIMENIFEPLLSYDYLARPV